MFAILEVTVAELEENRELDSNFTPESPKIKKMKSMINLSVAVLVVVSLSMAFLITAGAATSNFNSVFSSFSSGVIERDAARVRLLSMSAEELRKFLEEAKTRLTVNRDEVVNAFDIVRRRADFDSKIAQQLKDILKTKASTKPTELTSVLEERLDILLDAKTGRLSTARVDEELKFATRTDVSSTMRLARVTALTDAMQMVSLKPATSQLEALLQNDVFEIRMHAVDWFRLSPPVSVDERSRFLKTALASSLVQVRERAFRTIASWPSADVVALKKSGDVLPQKCAADTSSVIRSACTEIRSKAGPP